MYLRPFEILCHWLIDCIFCFVDFVILIYIIDYNELLYFRFLVDQSCIPPLCDLLTVMDSKIVQVALTGLENILRLGETDAKQGEGMNPYAVMTEECYGNIFIMNLL